MEGDEINHIYFLTKGISSFVLPSYENTRYIDISSGNYFGVIDIIGSAYLNKGFEL